MNSITPSTTKPVSFCVTLGRVHALRLEGDARTADLAPAIVAATGRLEQAAAARAEAVRAVKAVGLLRADTAKALDGQIRVACWRARSAAEVAGKPDALKAVFPETMSMLLYGSPTNRLSKFHSLAERLAASDGEASKAVADALAAFEAAQAAFVEARRKAQDSTHAVGEARRSWHEAFRLSFMAVALRIGSPRAALAFFLPLAPRSAPPPAPDGGGGTPLVPPHPTPQTA